MDEDYLQYGDIVHITSDIDHLLNEKTFLIDYIDANIIRVINSNEKHTINLEDDGTLSDKNIKSIIKLSSSTEKGFALQNKLISGKWIEIAFNADFPNIVGVITNLENDRIEIQIMDDEKEIIYLDFEYKGLPSFVKNITVRNVPEKFINSYEDIQQSVQIPKLDSIEVNDEVDHIHDRIEINNELKTMYLNSNELTFSDDVEKIVVRVEKEERFQKHSIEAQITDIVDTLLSTIPNHQRSDSVLGEVHHIVERYTQLRNIFSKKDENGTILCPLLYGKNNKPLASLMYQDVTFKKPKWILPVVSSQRKLYTTTQKQEEENILNQENTTIDNISNPLKAQYDLQRKYYRGSNTKYGYVEHMNDLNDLMIPYINNDDDNTTLMSQEVCNDEETIMLDAMTWNKDRIWSTTNNLIQKVTTSGNYTVNEKINIQSIIMMPDAVAELSKISLNNATIMERTSMNKSYISLFNVLNEFSKKNSAISKKIIDVYDEINYEANKVSQMCPADRPRTKHLSEEQFKAQNVKRKEQKLDTSDFLKYATNYVMDRNSSINEDNEKYAKFLYTIVPSTYELLKLSSKDKNMTKNYSFVEFVNKFLEPYLIYSKNIHYDEGYAFIRFAIKSAIESYKVKVLVDGKKSRRKILDLKKKNVIVFDKTPIDEIIKSNQQIYEKSYLGNEVEIFSQSSTTERLANMFGVDNINMMSSIIYSKNQHLVINPTFVEEVLDTVKTTGDKCSRNFITKRYTSLSELEKDNGVQVLYYDDDLDDTPYEILDNYKKEQNMENFDIFLKKKLIEKHSCPVGASSELAETLIQGKKRVMNDEYAVLKNDDMQIFYKRKGTANKWVIDRTVKPSVFINNNELFCNINNKCVKNEKTKTCDGFTEHKNIYITELKTRLDDLDTRLQIDNQKNSQNLLGFIIRNNNLKFIQSHRQNFISIELSKQVINDNSLKSPHISLRDDILSHQNFPEKQDYIILFAEQYTRKPILTDPLKIEDPAKETENPYWLYCTKTNTKLLPIFLLELANAFKNGVYQEKLAQICSDFGNSDGQGTYFDKNSGYTITKMDLVNNDEYSDDGFLISSHSIIDNTEEKNNNNFFHRSTNSVDIVFQALCAKLDIQYKEQEFRDFILKNATEMIDLIEDEETYKKKLSIIKKRDTKIIALPYDVFVNQNLIYIVTSLLFILIQTSVPSIKKVKTFEECVQSFNGFPLTSAEEDESGIRYMSCVILKLKGSMTPWDGILNIKENVFKENLKRKLIILLLRKDIKELYENKKIFDSEKVVQTKEISTNNIAKWMHVLPPLIQFTVKKNLVNTTREFHNELINLIKAGHKDQHKYIGIVRSKIITYGYAIIESINDIVRTKDFTMKTSSNIPYRQNSCCNENRVNELSTLHYFIKADNEILNYIDNSVKCELILSDIRTLSMAPLFFYEKDTTYKRLSNNSVSLQYRDNVIEAFIYYLKYDTNHPIPTIFKNKYVRPVKYNPKMTLDQKIEILETDKSNYDINALDNLLRTVNSKNMISGNAIVNDESIYDEAEQFRKFIDLKLNNINVENIIQGSVTDVLHNFSTTNINEFKIYIANVNETMRDKILQDVIDLLNVNEPEFATWSENLKNMTLMSSWNIYKEDKTTHINTILNFVKNVIYKMCKVYPSFINNNTTEHAELDKRWGLSSKHLNDLANFKSKNLFKFLNKYHSQDDKQVFSGDLKEHEDIIELCSNIPRSNKSDTYICETLLTYTWLSVFRVFIDSATDMNNNNVFVDGDRNFYKRRMIQMLSTFLEMESGNKKLLDVSMIQVENNSFKYRQIEKKMITDTLKELNSDGRKLMSQMKKIGLGIWREGKIGLVKYDPKAYDRNGIQSTDEGGQDEEENDVEEENNNIDEENGYDSGDGDGNNDNDNEYDT